MKALHLLYSASPDVTGASIRSRYLVEAQARLGIEPIVLSSPFQPPVDDRCAEGVERIDNIPYYRSFKGGLHGEFMAARKPLGTRLRKLSALPSFIARARAVALAERVDLLHGHSLFFCGLAAALAARSLGRPSLYEVRSLIEEGLVVQGGTTPRGIVYRGYRFCDMLAIRLATHITTISEGLKRDLIERGVPAQKITVVGNGVDGDRQRPAAPRDPAALAQWGFPPNAFVVGYIGTLFTYESLDLLIAAIAKITAAVPHLRVVLVGEGDAAETLRALVAQRKLESIVKFTGRVPHEAVGEYYSVIDLFVLPRRRNRLSDLVTPLKPLEIMARAKPLLASDCGGHLELVTDGVNGYTFHADDEVALAKRIRALSQQRDALTAVGESARRWVLQHRSWRAMVQPTVDLYARLLNDRGASRIPIVDPQRLSA